MTKKEYVAGYFYYYPQHLQMAQLYENGKSEKEISTDTGYSVNYIQDVRKKLAKLLEVQEGGWINICRELLILELIKPGTRIKYSHVPIPCPLLIQTFEDLQGREAGKLIKKKDREWKKKQQKKTK